MVDSSQKDKKLKEAIELEAIRERMLQNEKHRMQTTQAAALAREGNRERASAKADKKWEEVRKFADELIARGQQGYDNWVSAMSQILSACMKLNAAIAASNPIGSLIVKTGETVVSAYHALAHKSRTKKAQSYNEQDEFKRAQKAQELDVHLPDLLHLVEFNDDNSLNVHSITENFTRKDGKPFTPDQKKMFDIGVTAWIKTIGYDIKEEAGKAYIVKQKDDALNGAGLAKGTKITKEQFETLRDDPDHGLNAFLSGHFDMNFEQGLSSSPSP